MSIARESVPEGPLQESAVLALKLAVHVALPAVLLLALGAKLGPITQLGLHGRKFWRTLIVMGALIPATAIVPT